MPRHSVRGSFWPLCVCACVGVWATFVLIVIVWSTRTSVLSPMSPEIAKVFSEL